MKKFSSIGQFRNVVKLVKSHYEYIQMRDDIPTLSYTGTVKLHGSNGGIRRSEGVIEVQTRNNVIDLTTDNFGFAHFIDALALDDLHDLFDRIGTDPDDDITIFGEWIGKGIQKGTAISKLDRQFVIFGAYKNDAYVKNDKSWNISDQSIYNILKLPTYHVDVDFKQPQIALDIMIEITLGVEEQCPWGALYEQEGIGEGVVWTCDEHPEASDRWFKIKGSKHSNNKDNREKRMATVDPQVVENINQCVEIILTEERLKQGLDILQEQGLDIDPRNLGTYLKWISLDTRKEELDTIEANDLEWKDVVKLVTQKAKDFFFEQLTL